MEPVFEERTVLREPNRLLATALLALPLGAIVIAVMGLYASYPVWIGLQMGLGWWPARNRVYRENWRARERTAAVRVTSEGVTIDGVLAFPAARIADGFIVVRGGKRGVRLVDARGFILTEIEVEADEQAASILSAIGIAASRRRARFDALVGAWASRRWHLVTSVAMLVFLAMMGGLLGFIRLAPHVSPFLMYLLLPLMMVPAFFPAAFEIGADGILVRWWRLRRFIPYDEVRGAERHKRGVRIALKNGQSVDVALTGNHADIEPKQAAILVRIDEARKLHHSVTASRDLAARLGRGGRATSAWLREVKTVRDGQAGYREGAVREDDLWLVLEDSSAPEDARAAAAVLLREGGGPAKERIRVAAETTASPRLRVALDVAASDAGADAEAFDEALAELEAPAGELKRLS